jgi:hypothetical protein
VRAETAWRDRSGYKLSGTTARLTSQMSNPHGDNGYWMNLQTPGDLSH